MINASALRARANASNALFVFGAVTIFSARQRTYEQSARDRSHTERPNSAEKEEEEKRIYYRSDVYIGASANGERTVLHMPTHFNCGEGARREARAINRLKIRAGRWPSEGAIKCVLFAAF